MDAIECKWQPDAFETRGMAAFRENYPKGNNYIVSPLHSRAYERTVAGLKVKFVAPVELRASL